MSEGLEKNIPQQEEKERAPEKKYQLLYSVSANDYLVKEWEPWQVDDWERSGYRVNEGHYSQYGLYDTKEDLDRAVKELAGPDIFVVFRDRDSGGLYVTTENNTSGNWRGDKYRGDRLVDEFATRDEAEAYIKTQQAT